jgi:energy-coupling factor transporter ATP-binding protein EcfA2
MIKNRFPEELLDQPAQARHHYFNSLFILHPHLIKARDVVWNALHDVRPGKLINIIGPAGAGKTVLLSLIKHMLLTEALPGLLTDPGRIPFVAVDAIPSTTATHNWNDFLLRSLFLLNEPLIEEKELPHIIYSDGKRQTLRQYLTRDIIAPQLVRALEQSLRYRGVSTFIVDDAPYLRRMAWEVRIVEHFRNLREMFQRTGTAFLFVGTYDLLDLMLNMDLAGWKSVNIHFLRYHFESSEDQLGFQNILLTFQQHAPVIMEPNFVQHVKYLHSGCVGCVGLLKSWLSRALAVALEDRSGTITFDHLERTKWPLVKLEKLVDEIEQGEDMLMQWKNQREKHLKRSQRQLASPPKLSRNRVAQRNPVRDRVGE